MRRRAVSDRGPLEEFVMETVKLADVARLCDGAVHDRAEAERILEAIEREPLLAAAADLFSGKVTEEDHELRVPRFLAEQFDAARRALAWWIEPPSQPDRWGTPQ